MKNQLEIIVEESKLEPTKAKYILEQFQNYFELADEWNTKAKTLVVTSADQVAEMKMARTGRLFLREKRLDVENARKTLKEQSLREGKAIDGIANVLKALIVPIEEYLEHQEKFVEIQEEKKREVMRLEIEKRMEDERIAAEKAAIEAQEKMKIENEKLKAEAQKKERELMAERKKQEETLRVERAKASRLRELAEEKANTERQTAEAKAQKERAKLEAERKEKQRLEAILKAQVECPKCHHKFLPNKED